MMPDREKTIKSIEDCVYQKIDCVDCRYDGCVFKHGDCKRDLLADALELLKEQEAIVRCKDCKKRNSWECWQYFFGRFNIPDEWFCADGEKDGDGE